MATLLLVIIYMAFISLGLPDAVLGSAWPVIHENLNVSVSSVGIMTMIISGGTIISSLFSQKIIKVFGTGKVTMVSVAMTAIGLIGISVTPSYLGMCLLAIPLGLGAGSVDSALNNFVALHYEAKHMNWLHCFWGIGATAGPFLMSMFLLKENGWRTGYSTIGTIQAILVIVLIITLPVWKKFEKNEDVTEAEKRNTSITALLKLKGAKPTLLAFFCYCSVEATTGLWGSSFLVISKGISAEKAAKWVSLYYLGITVGRFLAGFIAMKFNNKKMIRLGQIISLCGAITLVIPFSIYFQMVGLILIGLGCAPIYPAMLHETPSRFGSEMSQGIMGVQMATAYVGSTFMPPLFGIIGKYMAFNLLPFYLVAIVIIMILSTERVNQIICKE
jgi:fucose permease